MNIIFLIKLYEKNSLFIIYQIKFLILKANSNIEYV